VVVESQLTQGSRTAVAAVAVAVAALGMVRRVGTLAQETFVDVYLEVSSKMVWATAVLANTTAQATSGAVVEP
jgi:hypothetical protein